MAKETPFGLGASTSSGERFFLPLQSVSVNASIFDVTALVELKQKYVNPPGNGRLGSARYVFPIPANAAVCAFKMEDSTGRTVTGVVKETQKAKQDFQEAVSKGKFSGLAHEVAADVFSISIGAIPPDQSVEITLSYSMDIPENESERMNQIRFALPTFIGQRYGGTPAELSQARSDDTAALFTFNANVRLTSNIIEITSPSHKSDVVVQQTQVIQSGATPLYGTDIKLREPFPLDREFVLSIQAERLDLPRCIAEVNTADETVALMLTLVPRLGAPDVSAQEYIFVVDRSGSMSSESRIGYARDALKHLMKGLPSNNTHFNIVSFGNQFSSLWRESVAYNRDNLAAAITHIDGMTANMGGTEIGGAIDWVFLNRMTNKPTAVFVLTDGEIWHPDAVINSVSQKVMNSGSTNFLRVFTIGIGNGASTALCSGLARVGNGVCFMTTRSEQIKDRCSKLLRAARALPYGNTCDLKIDWGYDTVPHTPSKLQATNKAQVEAAPEPDPSKPIDFFDTSINPFAKTKDIGLQFELPAHPNVLQAPTQPPNFYPGNRFLVSAILANTLQPPEKIVLKGTLPGGLPVEIPVKVAYILGNQSRIPLLHTLAAKRFIRELEDGDVRALNIPDYGDKTMRRDVAKAAVIEYGVRYKLASRFTAFVAIENDNESADEVKELKEDADEVETLADDDDWVMDVRNDTSERDRERERSEEESDEDMGFDVIRRAKMSAQLFGRKSSAQGMSAPVTLSSPAHGTSILFGGPSKQSHDHSARFADLMAPAPPAPPPAPLSAQRRGRPSQAPLQFQQQLQQQAQVAPTANMRYQLMNTGFGGSPALPIPMPPMGGPPPPMMRARVGTSGHAAPAALYYNPGPPRGGGLGAQAPVVAADPVSEVTDLQSHDGSFVFDGSLLVLLQRKKGSLSLDGLKAAMPETIRNSRDADTIWATVLATAYMLVALADSRSVWDSLWDKAQEMVCQAMNIAPYQFNQLVQAASAELQ